MNRRSVRFINDLIGHDRRERRGTFVLACLVLVMIIFRYAAFRPGNVLPDRVTDTVPEQALVSAGQVRAADTASVFFDPNTATREQLVAAGLSERQASTLINYREAGATFRKPDDIFRVYGIDSVLATKLLKRIRIAQTDGRERVWNETPVAPLRPEDPVSIEATAVRNESTVPAELDLNLSSAAELEMLPGIGPVLSQRIISYRRLLGGFVSAGQLSEVYGIDSTVAKELAVRLTVTFDSVRGISLDSCTWKELAAHPYIGRDMASLIIRYRQLMGLPVTLSGLVRDKVMTEAEAVRVSPYIRPSEGVKGDDYEFISSKVLK